MFLYDGRVVFSLLMILFTFFRFVFCSCDSVSSWLLGSVSFGSVEFLFSEVGSSFSLDCFCLTPLDVIIIIIISISIISIIIIVLFMCFLMDF